MDQNFDFIRPHYHIHWQHRTTLDWECFHTYSEAAIRAAELAGPYETYAIEEVSSDCPLYRAKSASAS